MGYTYVKADMYNLTEQQSLFWQRRLFVRDRVRTQAGDAYRRAELFLNIVGAALSWGYSIYSSHRQALTQQVGLCTAS